MAEVLHNNLAKIEASDIHARLGLEKGKYILLSAHREENIDPEKNFLWEHPVFCVNAESCRIGRYIAGSAISPALSTH
jgi:hypothetical protein